MKHKNMCKELLKIVTAIFVTLAIAINTSMETVFLSFNNGNSYLWVICAIFIYQVLTEVLKIKDKRLMNCALILGILFSTFSVVGTSINRHMNLSGIISSNITLLKSTIKWLGYIILISSTIIILYDKFNKIMEKFKDKPKTDNMRDKFSQWFTSNKRSFFACSGVIFLAWIPYLLRYYPGILTPDSVDQVKQALGISVVNAHHPLFHTMIIKMTMKIGSVISGQNVGVLVYSLMQMAIMSAIFSFAIYYMAKKGIPTWIRVMAIVFFALYPVNALYSITMWKNILAGGAILLFVICMTEITTNQISFFASRLKCLALIAVSLLVIYTINNGIYIIVLTAPFVILIARKHLKKVLIIFAVVLLIYFAINTTLFSVLKIKKGSIREALSIPLQQFARVVKYREGDLTNEEKQSIYNYLPSDKLGELYNPTLSDPVKSLFNDEYFDDNKLEFIVTWMKLFFKFPLECIESFLCNCYGYWYPEATNWVVARYMQQDSALEIRQTPKIEGELVTKIDSLIDKREIPILSMAFSLGFSFWMVLSVIMYCIYRKKYNLTVIYIPILVLWLTVIASPVFCEYRYLYGMIASLPILLSVPMFNKEIN